MIRWVANSLIRIPPGLQPQTARSAGGVGWVQLRRLPQGLQRVWLSASGEAEWVPKPLRPGPPARRKAGQGLDAHTVWWQSVALARVSGSPTRST